MGRGIRQIKRGRLNLICKHTCLDDIFESCNGFDVVVGNPPYLDSETMMNNDSEYRQKIQSTYGMTRGNWDIYIPFFEKCFILMRQNAMLSFITPDKWLSKPYGYELRMQLKDNFLSILRAGKKIFIDATVDAIITSITKRHCKEFHILEYKDFKAVHKRSVLKSNIKKPYAYDMFFSDDYEILLEIDKQTGRISDYGTCKNACATSDAYKLKDMVCELSHEDESSYFKVVNTGIIGKYVSRWGNRRMVYLGNKYTKPIVDKLQFESSFKNSYGKKAGIPKLILKGVTMMDVCIDINGSILPGKTTLMVTSDSIDNLKFLLAILNSKIVIFYLKNKYSSSSFSSGSISFTKEMINEFPLPVMSFENRSVLIGIIDDILTIKQKDINVDISLYQKAIDDIVCRFYGLTATKLSME